MRMLTPSLPSSFRDSRDSAGSALVARATSFFWKL